MEEITDPKEIERVSKLTQSELKEAGIWRIIEFSPLPSFDPWMRVKFFKRSPGNVF